MTVTTSPAFIAIVPARLASTRLPRKPLADIGGQPMVVRVAKRALASGAQRVVVAADSAEIVVACREHGVDALLTSPEHPTGTDRLAEAAVALCLDDDAIVVNVQGDEPLMPPPTLAAVAALLQRRSDCEIATAAHPLHDAAELFSPNVVKVVTDASGRALLFSRAPIPWSRDAFAAAPDRPPNGLPGDLPEYVAVDLANLQVGQTVHVRDIPLPAGVKAMLGGRENPAVITVTVPAAPEETAAPAAAPAKKGGKK